MQRWKGQKEDARRLTKKSPSHKLTHEEEQTILKELNSARFIDKTPREIVPLLADENIYLASESTFYRVLKKHNLLTHRSRARSRKPRPVPTLKAIAPNQVWSWDISYLKGPRRGSFFYLYLIMDIFSRKIIYWKVHKEENSEFAANLLKEACLKENIQPGQVTLHSDNGSPMRGVPMLTMMQSLGVQKSFSRPRVSNDNPFSESLFKTVKYHPKWPTEGFNEIQAAEEWVRDFAYWYNKEHMHSSINWITPEERHQGQDEHKLQQRKLVYENAKKRNPLRWSRNVRDWQAIKEVSINERKKEGSNQNLAICSQMS